MGGHKKHKKKHKKEKKKKSKRRSSTSESSSEGGVWVEKDSGSSDKKGSPPPPSQDDWLTNSDNLFAAKTREEFNPKRTNEKDKADKPSIEMLGQSSKELNPYWKDGGSGLPQEDPGRVKLAGTVGDLGLGWLLRALDRAKQTAAEDKIPLEDVVAPVWGSLDKLLNLIQEAEKKVDVKSRGRYYGAGSSRSDRNFEESSRERDRRGFHRPDLDDKAERKYQDRSSRDDNRPKGFKRPEGDSQGGDSREGRKYDFSDRPRGFRNPRNNWNDRLEQLKKSYKEVQRSSWKKSTTTSEQRTEHEVRTDHNKRAASTSPEPVQTEKTSSTTPEDDGPPVIMTQEEMDEISAEILKAEKSGNEDQVKKLKEKLKRGQAWLSCGPSRKSKEPKEVLLTQTNRYGFTEPVSSSSFSHPHTKKKGKVETHKDGKRVRYFANDDKYTLQDLVHQEKFISVSDQNEMYTRLSKGTGQNIDDDDFEEGGGRERTEEWADFSKRQRAARDSTRREKVLESCRFCLDSDAAERRLVISLMDKVYLAIPSFRSLTDGHCLIMPIQHTPCTTLLDEDVWEQVMDLRKLLVKMFLEEDKDIIFYESAKNLDKFPHMVLNCVPVPKEVGDDSPIYFKKALLECETEWSDNKKLVDLKGRDVRKAVPKGLSYFWVDFGLQSGYAHVIEDERLFPRNFAEEIIGGMMDMDHLIWRKKKKENQEVLIAKTQEFIKKFKEFTAKNL